VSRPADSSRWFPSVPGTNGNRLPGKVVPRFPPVPAGSHGTGSLVPPPFRGNQEREPRAPQSRAHGERRCGFDALGVRSGTTSTILARADGLTFTGDDQWQSYRVIFRSLHPYFRYRILTSATTRIVMPPRRPVRRRIAAGLHPLPRRKRRCSRCGNSNHTLASCPAPSREELVERGARTVLRGSGSLELCDGKRHWVVIDDCVRPHVDCWCNKTGRVCE
jgi:hypothetical protein